MISKIGHSQPKFTSGHGHVRKHLRTLAKSSSGRSWFMTCERPKQLKIGLKTLFWRYAKSTIWNQKWMVLKSKFDRVIQAQTGRSNLWFLIGNSKYSRKLTEHEFLQPRKSGLYVLKSAFPTVRVFVMFGRISKQYIQTVVYFWGQSRNHFISVLV